MFFAACVELITGHTPPTVPDTALKLNIQNANQAGFDRSSYLGVLPTGNPDDISTGESVWG